MVVGLGLDLFDVNRLARELAEGGPAFTRSLFTPAEIEHCDRQRWPARHYAVCFAAKEAVAKALGLDPDLGWSWRDVDVLDDGGALHVRLHGPLHDALRRRGATRVHLAVSRSPRVALASVLLEA
jgi:holo-[acyl-carrier protein] synthase